MGEQSEVDEELVARDLPEFLHVLDEMKEKVCVVVPVSYIAANNSGLQVPVVTRHVEQLLCHVTSPETSTENGISLLDVKVQLLLRLAARTSPKDTLK